MKFSESSSIFRYQKWLTSSIEGVKFYPVDLLNSTPEILNPLSMLWLVQMDFDKTTR